jgi:hypothetical protein
MRQCKKKEKLILVDKYLIENMLNLAINQERRKKKNKEKKYASRIKNITLKSLH